MIMKAGSGHLGTSFSAMDIASWLWLFEQRLIRFRSSSCAFSRCPESSAMRTSRSFNASMMLARSIASNFLAFDVKNELKTEAEVKQELEKL